MLNGAHQHQQQPFAGLLFSCTGIEPAERDVVKRRVEQLGGQYSGHLTRRVTHLIVGRLSGSDKYKSAKEVLKIPVLRASFVEDCFTRSRLGLVELPQMERLHAVKVLQDCKICVTGMSAEGRERVSRLAQRLGGQYSPELTRSCTHLISEGETNSGPKVQFASRWSIPVVRAGWLEACEDKDMFLEPDSWLVRVTQCSQRVVNERDVYAEVSLADIHAAADDGLPAYLDGTRIYLASAGLDQNRLNLLKRLILVAGGTRYSENAHTGGVSDDVTHLIVHNQILSSREVEQLRRYATPPIVVHDQWLLACFVARSRIEPGPYLVSTSVLTQSFTADNTQTPTVGSSRSLWATRGGRENRPPATTEEANWMVPRRKEQSIDTPPLTQSQSQSTFRGTSLSLHPHLNSQYKDSILRHGGTAFETGADYSILPTVVYKEETETFSGAVVNELWLLECLAQRTLLPTDLSSFYAPIYAKQPIDRQAFSSINICPTGFAVPERDYYARLFTSGLGGAFSEALSRHNTHLLCKANGCGGPKIDFARKTGIPCVTEAWLLGSAAAGFPLPVGDFLVDPDPVFEPPAKRGCSSSISSLPAVALSTPLRKDLNARLRQATAELLPPAPERSALPMTQAIAREALSTLLNSLVFSISQRLWHRREELYELVTSLGGTFLWAYDAACTHYLHQGNQAEETFREFKLARHCGKKIVSPHWLLQCRDAGCRLPEADYPHHYDPNRALEEPAVVVGETIAPALAPITDTPILTMPAVDVPDTYAATLDPSVSLLPMKTRLVTYAGVGSSSESEDEPHHILTRPSSTEGLSQTTRRLSIATAPSVFMLSGLSGAEKQTATQQLSALGQSVFDQTEYSPKITHLISRQTTKSEKYLAACASGTWILRPEYIQACADAGRMLPETEWEIQPAWNDAAADGAIKAAPRAWRKYLASSGKAGAFADWVVLLAVDNKRLPGFTRILEAGSAKSVTTLVQLEETSAQRPAFTHIISSSQAMRGKIPLSVTEGLSPDTFKPLEFIAEHLLSNPRL